MKIEKDDGQHRPEFGGKPGASAMTPEQRTKEIANVNADAKRNLLPGSANGSNALKAGLPKLGAKPPAAPKPMGGLPTPKSPMATTSKMNVKPGGNAAKKFSIMDRLLGAGSNLMNTIGKMGKQVQSKNQNAAAMPGVNQKMIKAEDIFEMLDILKGQFSKLGKPGATEAARAGATQFVQSKGTATPPRGKAAVAPKAVPATPPHASMTQPSQPIAAPVAAKPVAPHVAEAHEAVKSKAHHNKIAGNIAKVKAAKAAEAVKPNTLANPKPQDHAVKSPENAAHFKEQAAKPTAKPVRAVKAKPAAKQAQPKPVAAPAPQVQAKPIAKPVSQTERTANPRVHTEVTSKPGNVHGEKTPSGTNALQTFAKPKPRNVISAKDPRAHAAVAAAQKRKFQSEKTAPHTDEPDNGWKASHEEETARAAPAAPVAVAAPAQSKDSEYEKTVKTKYADINDPALDNAKSVHGESNESAKAAPVSKRPESEPATAAHGRPGSGFKPKSANVAQNKPQASGPAPVSQAPAKAPNVSSQPQASQQAPVDEHDGHKWINQMKANKAGAANQSAAGEVQAPQSKMQTKDFGVKRQMHPEEAHSHLIHFLHQLVNPGGPTHGQGEERGLVQHSRNFMGKSETTAKVNTPVSAQRNQMKAAGRMRMADTKAAGINRKQKQNTLAMPYKPSSIGTEATAKLPPKPPMLKSDEATQKDSVGATAAKIKEGAKSQPPAKQAELLTNPDNHPPHNRKKILQLMRSCGKMS